MMPPGGFKPDKFEMKFDDLQLEAVFSNMLSSVNTVLIFLIPVSGIGTLVYYYFTKKKYYKEMNEVVLEEMVEMSEDRLEEIFTFGYIE